MKTLALLAISSLVSVTAFAQAINPRTVTCAELQEIVANDGEASVLKKHVFGYNYAVTVLSTPECRLGFEPWVAKFTTKDVKKCKAGYTCVREIEDDEDIPRRCEIFDC